MADPAPLPASLDARAALTAGATMWSTAAVPELGIPTLTMADGPMGIASGRVDERDVSRLTPCPLALGASFDVDLARRIGRLVGGEAQGRGIGLVLAPNVNLARSPLSGRTFEYFAEDPLLAGMMGAAWSSGVQSAGVGAAAKHLVCNDSETDRDRMNAVVDARALREVYLLPFQLCAEAGCAAMMTAYNRINGEWCAEAGDVITTIAKREWRYDGMFVSDFFATHSLASAVAGLDLEMPGPARHHGAQLAVAVRSGELAGARLDDAAARVARAARRFGGDRPAAEVEDADALLEEAAAAGFTLLRNDGLLPLDPARLRRIAVIGPNASAPCYQGGTFAKIAVTPDAPTPLEAIRRQLGDKFEISYEPGVDPQPRLPGMPVAGGMRLAYFDDPDCAGEPLSAETRDTNSLVWFKGVHEQLVFDRPASVRACGTFTPVTGGVHRFHLGGTGAVRMLVDDREILHADEPVAPGDTMGKLKRGDAIVAELDLAAGVSVEVVVEFRHAPARVHGLWFGIRPPGTPQELLARAEAAARQADAVVLIVGESSDASVESKDRPDTLLARDQLALIERVAAANPRVAAVVNVGHAFDAGWDDKVAALLVAWYPGQAFGTALAKVLSGLIEPGGRLPVTIAEREVDYPAFGLTPDANGDLVYADGVAIGYRGFAARGIVPRHAFGSGRGYAEIEWLSAAAVNGAVEVRLRNRSDHEGAEVVQLYRHAPEFALIGFAKAVVPAGGEATVTVVPNPHLLRVWNDGWQPLEGPLSVSVGRSASDLPFELAL